MVEIQNAVQYPWADTGLRFSCRAEYQRVEYRQSDFALEGTRTMCPRLVQLLPISQIAAYIRKLITTRIHIEAQSPHLLKRGNRRH